MCSSSNSFAQFTYLEGTVGYFATNLNDDRYTNKNKLRSFSFSISGVRRFMRPFGIGLDLEIPFYQQYTHGEDLVNPSGTGSSGYFGWSAYPSGARPDFDYHIKKNIVPRALFRIYLGDGLNDFYCEARFAFSSIKEELIVKRDAFTSSEGNQFPQLDDSYESNVAYTLGGFAVGYQDTNEQGWFFKARAGFDILSYDRSDLRVSVPVDVESDELIDVQFRSFLVKNSTLWFFDIGTGYFF